MSKLNLASAVKKFKQIKSDRNLDLFGNTVERTITNQIRLIRGENTELKIKRDETIDELNTNFIEVLLNLDEYSLSTSDKRKTSAESYIANAITVQEHHEAEIKRITEQIESNKKDIKRLIDLEKILIDIKAPYVEEKTEEVKA